MASCADCRVCVAGGVPEAVGRGRRIARRLWLTVVVGRCGRCGHRAHRDEAPIGSAGMSAGYVLGTLRATGGSPVEQLAHLDQLLAERKISQAEYRLVRTAIMGGLGGDRGGR